MEFVTSWPFGSYSSLRWVPQMRSLVIVGADCYRPNAILSEHCITAVEYSNLICD